MRGGGVQDGVRWAHVGDGDSYIALTKVGRPAPEVGDLNHLGYVAGDMDALARRLISAGFREGFVSPPHPYRKRRYFLDADNREWEFVEYLSNDPGHRNVIRCDAARRCVRLEAEASASWDARIRLFIAIES